MEKKKKSELYITLYNEREKAKINRYLNGFKKITCKEECFETFDLGVLPEGLYIIGIQANKTLHHKKILVQ